MRVVSGVTIGARSALYAVQAGIFKKYGLDVDLVKAGSGGGTPLSALIGGSFQVDYVNVVSLIQAYVQGISLQIIAPGSMYDTNKPYSLLFVRKDSPIRTARDLNGKTSASQALKDINALCTLAWVDANGGDSKTLHGIELPNSAMLPALDDGRIDVTSLVPPFQTFALEAGKYRVLGKSYDAIAKHFQIAVWAATAEYVSKNPDVARRFAAAMRESSTFANANPSKTDDLVASFTGIEPHIVAHSPGPQDPPYLTAADVQPVIDVALRYGFIAKGFNADEVISPVVRRPA
ncbi:MAG TPA: ABC transporter substrate-binding protein [Candidatus Binatia bacterium]|nr:ABC transporter substrate-binding protein [Candidatus Binatia bacterium]